MISRKLIRSVKRYIKHNYVPEKEEASKTGSHRVSRLISAKKTDAMPAETPDTMPAETPDAMPAETPDAMHTDKSDTIPSGKLGTTLPEKLGAMQAGKPDAIMPEKPGPMPNVMEDCEPVGFRSAQCMSMGMSLPTAPPPSEASTAGYDKCEDLCESINTHGLESLIARAEETFSDRLLRLIDERNLTDSEVYNKARIDRRHFSKIRNDSEYKPTKTTVYAFALALELSLDETVDLLNSAGYAFSRSSKRDIILLYCFENRIYDLFTINEILEEFEQKIVG